MLQLQRDGIAFFGNELAELDELMDYEDYWME
jgi:hypothetical protein